MVSGILFHRASSVNATYAVPLIKLRSYEIMLTIQVDPNYQRVHLFRHLIDSRAPIPPMNQLLK